MSIHFHAFIMIVLLLTFPLRRYTCHFEFQLKSFLFYRMMRNKTPQKGSKSNNSAHEDVQYHKMTAQHDGFVDMQVCQSSTYRSAIQYWTTWITKPIWIFNFCKAGLNKQYIILFTVWKAISTEGTMESTLPRFSTFCRWYIIPHHWIAASLRAHRLKGIHS